MANSRRTKASNQRVRPPPLLGIVMHQVYDLENRALRHCSVATDLSEILLSVSVEFSLEARLESWVLRQMPTLLLRAKGVANFYGCLNRG